MLGALTRPSRRPTTRLSLISRIVGTVSTFRRSATSGFSATSTRVTRSRPRSLRARCARRLSIRRAGPDRGSVKNASSGVLALMLCSVPGPNRSKRKICKKFVKVGAAGGVLRASFASFAAEGRGERPRLDSVAMGGWYWIGVAAGLGAGAGIALGALVPEGIYAGLAVLFGIAAGIAIGLLVGDWAEAAGGGTGGLLGAVASMPIVIARSAAAARALASRRSSRSPALLLRRLPSSPRSATPRPHSRRSQP